MKSIVKQVLDGFIALYTKKCGEKVQIKIRIDSWGVLGGMDGMQTCAGCFLKSSGNLYKIWYNLINAIFWRESAYFSTRFGRRAGKF
jgi:hypothetical protein